MAVAAIGATVSPVAVFTNFIVGTAVGASAVIAQRIGSKNKHALETSLHTSVGFGFLLGGILCLVGVFLSRPILRFMGTPDSILEDAASYMAVLGISYLPQTIYNFGSAGLRAVGDTKRPLYILAIAGVVKTGLTYVFVVILEKSIAYVAFATAISFVLSSVLTLIALHRMKGECQLQFRRIRLCLPDVKDIVITGIPSECMLSFVAVSNVFIQSAVNSLGELAIAGNTAANQVSTALYNVLNAFSHTATIYCGACYGANDRNGFKRTLVLCLLLMTVCGLFVGSVFFVVQGWKRLFRMIP